MGLARVAGVQLRGISAAVPETERTVEDLAQRFGADAAANLTKSTGVRLRPTASEKLCTSDLCFAAAKDLLTELDWDPDSIDLLVFVSQTPDYILPATSTVLHERLGLAPSCAAFDVGLGCSGYVYGLWIAGKLLAGRGPNRALLLAGDTSTRLVSSEDRSTVPLFGDAGTATALEVSESAPDIVFSMGTDGKGYRHLMVPAGGFRQPSDAQTKERRDCENGNRRSEEDLYMNGTEIFAFALREVQPLFNAVVGEAGWQLEELDAVIFHQANAFMLKHLGKRLKIPTEKLVVAMESYGNASSASIPLAMVDSLKDELAGVPRKLVMVGFGVGFSWAAAALSCGDLRMPSVRRVGVGEVVTV